MFIQSKKKIKKKQKCEATGKISSCRRNKKVPFDSLVPDKQVIIGTGLSQEEENILIEFLQSNRDVFAWTSNDLGGVSRDTIEHKLDINLNFRPKKQKLRKLVEDNTSCKS
jgi:hypothetical protein